MIYRLIVKSLAENDIREILEWYINQSEYLPKKFLLELDSGFDTITKNPEYFQKRYNQIRVLFLNKFPYGLYYTIEEDIVFVHAVLHNKRNPLTGIKRV
ncbi:type II toxin-antitoxin system RelE/ParE family toxin [Parapedobacter sp. SGR-10]|uniref:type II toxin-antitoxin system RelE/ParE family toxin n=1 Tax=Parapedobacter sp. SGR-10 TaxID=2710879 RepID=UPI0013D171C7|nr:type II toxin-antitoxin system RelE/ParE family toxin [Parapedobacter sp. SGR-10]